jgi:hypothetical protein
MDRRETPGAGVTAAGAKANGKKKSETNNEIIAAPQAGGQTFSITLRAEHGVDGVRALRHLLKRAARSYGLRAIDVREVAS